MCQYCQSKHPLKRHPTRKHKRPPREFWLCPCGKTVQGISKTTEDGSTYVKEIPIRIHNPTVVKTVRLTLAEEAERKKTGETVRGFIERKARASK